MDEHALQSFAEAVHSARPPYLVTLAACNYAISHPDTVDRLLLSYLSHRDPLVCTPLTVVASLIQYNDATSLAHIYINMDPLMSCNLM